MELNTSTLGIHQSDIIIRTALIKGIEDIRANPWLLDYIFASLKYDTVTKNQYGEKEMDVAKKWFLSTDIPIFMNTRLDDAQFPCISIALAESNELENTLGDVHYDPQEDINYDWPIAIGPFRPATYDALTGTMVIPESDIGIELFVGMFAVDKNGRSFEILEVVDYRTFVIAAGTVADFSSVTIRPPRPAYVVSLESASFKETYSIGLHVPSDSVFLTYLHPIVVFILLRYRQSLLEARGFERSALTSGPFQKDSITENEVIYSRYIQVSGFVRQYWPKDLARKIDSTVAIAVPEEAELDLDALEDDFLNHDSLTPNIHT